MREIFLAPFGGTPAWSPTALGSNVIQRMDSLVYRESTIAGAPVLNDSSRTGSARSNLQGRALLFDGVNDYASRSRITTPGITTLTACCWVKFAHANHAAFIGEWHTTNENRCWLMLHEADAPGKLKVLISPDGGWGSMKDYRSSSNINTGSWVHIAFTWASGTLKIFVNGLEESATKEKDDSFTTIANVIGTDFRIGAINNSPIYFANASMRDFRVYSTVKTPEQILAIANQHLDPTNIDSVGILGGWYGNDQAGTTLRDWSGNGRHLTTSGITEATFHAADSGVLWNPANEVGHNIQQNLWTQSEDLTDGSVSLFNGASVSANAAVAPDGTTTADRVTFTSIASLLRKTITLVNGTVYRISFYAKWVSGDTTIGTDFGDGGYDSATATSSWARYSFTIQANGNSRIDVWSSAAAVFDLWGFQVEVGNETSTYTRTTTSAITARSVVPRNEATPANDVLGNALAHTGQVPHYATVEVPCITGDGSAAYVDTGSRLFPATANFSASCWYYHQTNDTNFRPVLSQMLTNDAGTPGRFNIMANSNNGTATAGWLCVFAQGSTSVLASINTLQSATWHYITIERNSDVFTLSCTPLNGSLSTVTQTVSGISIAQNANTHLLRHPAPVLNNGRITDFRITTGGVTRFFPLQDGIGAAGTNRNLSWVGSDGSGGVLSNALVGGTLANVWANRTNVARDWAVQYGGRVSGGVFIPGHISSSNCVDGNAKTLLAGRNCNPNSRINPNPFSVSGLNGSGSSTGIAVGTGRRLVAPANTKFSRSTRVSGFRALDFDGSNDSVRIGTPASLQPTTALSVSCWINRNSTAAMYPFASWTNGPGCWALSTSTNSGFGWINNSGSSSGRSFSGTIPVGSWTHLAVTVNATTGDINLYINGTLSNGSYDGQFTGTFAILRMVAIGSLGDNAFGPWNGRIDDVRQWNRVLTAGEITTLAANRAGAAIGGEAGWWCPTRDRDGFRTLTARDLIGSNHATLTNMDAESDWIDETETMDDRFFTVRTALTGTDLTKAEGWVA